MKKWICMLLAVLTLFTCVPLGALATEIGTGEETAVFDISMTLSNTAKGVTIKWNAVKGADSYRVYRRNGEGDWKLLKGALTDVEYTDTTAESGVTYFYIVRAVVGGVVKSNQTFAEFLRLDQPKITVSNYSGGIQTEWNEITGAESYNVYRRVPGGKWQFLTNVSGTSYRDKTAEEGVTYYYAVRAKSGSTLSSINYRQKIQRLAQPDVTAFNVYNGVTIKWNAVDGAQTYRVYRKVPGGSWTALKKGITELSYTDTTPKSGVTYLYAVRACNSTGYSGYASTSELVCLSRPEASASNKSGGIKISWNEINGAESYNVYRKVPGGSWEKLNTVTDISYLDPTAESGNTYRYMIRAKNGASLSSNKYQVSILRLSRPEVTLSNGSKGVSVKWNAVEGAESYRVYRRVPDGSWKLLKSGVTALSFTDTSAKSGVTYEYSVRAFGSGVLSSYAAAKSIQRLERPVLTVKTVSTTRVKLTWDSVSGAEEYIVYAKTSDTDWEKLYTGSGTSYTAKDLTFGETYSFAVRACSDSSRSARSASETAKATYPAPSYSLEPEPGDGISISWKAVDGAGSYRVYRRTEGGSWKGLKTTTSTSYVDTSGQPGTTYEYAVRAFELAGAKGVSGIRATGKSIVYTKIDPDKPMIALTFDDGPSQYTADILDQLEKYGAHATFFVVGNRVSTYSKTIKRAYALGCEIGNHSWSHPSLSAISVSAMKKEISKTDAAIKKVIGVVPTLLRPPYGAVDSDVKKYAGKPLIHWSIDTRDWATQSSSRTVSSVLNNVRDGSIILMHDIYSATRNAAVKLIPILIKRGYQLVTVSELAAYRDVNLKDGRIYYSIYP